jgi:hypothetical protein
MKIVHIVSILILISCSGKVGKNSNEIIENFTTESHVNENVKKVGTYQLLENGLMSNLKGDWITTILPDSILQSREILKWKNIFYGDLMISINENDTAIIGGNMDKAPLKYEVVDEKTFVLPEWHNTKVIYSPEQDLIYLGGPATGRVYKRSPSDDFLKVISNEKLLMEYVIKILFKEEYLPRGLCIKN